MLEFGFLTFSVIGLGSIDFSKNKFYSSLLTECFAIGRNGLGEPQIWSDLGKSQLLQILNFDVEISDTPGKKRTYGNLSLNK